MGRVVRGDEQLGLLLQRRARPERQLGAVVGAVGAGGDGRARSARAAVVLGARARRQADQQAGGDEPGEQASTCRPGAGDPHAVSSCSSSSGGRRRHPRGSWGETPYRCGWTGAVATRRRPHLGATCSPARPDEAARFRNSPKRFSEDSSGRGGASTTSGGYSSITTRRGEARRTQTRGPVARTPPARAVTLSDVARLAGVSVATASKALNGRDQVKDTTRQRVVDAAEQLVVQPEPDRPQPAGRPHRHRRPADQRPRGPVRHPDPHGRRGRVRRRTGQRVPLRRARRHDPRAVPPEGAADPARRRPDRRRPGRPIRARRSATTSRCRSSTPTHRRTTRRTCRSRPTTCRPDGWPSSTWSPADAPGSPTSPASTPTRPRATAHTACGRP